MRRWSSAGEQLARDSLSSSQPAADAEGFTDKPSRSSTWTDPRGLDCKGGKRSADPRHAELVAVALAKNQHTQDHVQSVLV